MARTFNGTDTYLGGLPAGFLDGLSAATISIKFSTTNEDHQLLLHYYKDTSDAFVLALNHDPIGIFTYIEEADDKEQLTHAVQISDGVVHHIGVTMSTVATNHRLFYDGVQRDYVAADDLCFSSIEAGAAWSIGRSNWGGGSIQHVDGSIMEIAIYNTVLTLENMVQLGPKCISPKLILPQNLVHYWSLVRELNDPIGNQNLTAFNNPGVAAHPRIILPCGEL